MARAAASTAAVALLVPLLLATTAAEAAATFPPPRLPGSPFPVPARAPARVFVLNATGASFDLRVLLLSLSGLVAQQAPEAFVFDAHDVGGTGPTGRGAGGPTGGMSLFQLGLLPAELPVT